MTTPHPAAPAPADPAEAAQPQPRSRMRGNWRSLVLSMGAVALVVLGLIAVVPRPSAVTQPAFDVAPVARQVQREDGVTVLVPQLGEGWKASAARYEATPQGPKAWYVGYFRADTDDVFVAVRQIPASTPAEQASAWLKEAVSDASAGGTVEVDGRSWRSYSTGGAGARQFLVADVDGMTTVVGGLVDQATLIDVVRSLRPFQG